MDYIKASEYWKNKVKSVAPDDVILSTVNSILSGFRHCTLATASDGEVDSTPVHYIYMDECIYIFSEGGDKFRHLMKNKNVSISVFNHDGDFGNIHSVQVYGIASIVEELSAEYMKAVDNSVYKLNAEYLKKRAEMGEAIHLIKIVPNKYKVTDSNFKKDGFDINQVLIREV